MTGTHDIPHKKRRLSIEERSIFESFELAYKSSEWVDEKIKEEAENKIKNEAAQKLNKNQGQIVRKINELTDYWIDKFSAFLSQVVEQANPSLPVDWFDEQFKSDSLKEEFRISLYGALNRTLGLAQGYFCEKMIYDLAVERFGFDKVKKQKKYENLKKIDVFIEGPFSTYKNILIYSQIDLWNGGAQGDRAFNISKYAETTEKNQDLCLWFVCSDPNNINKSYLNSKMRKHILFYSDFENLFSTL